MANHNIAIKDAELIVKDKKYRPIDCPYVNLAKAYLELSPLHWQNSEAKEATKRRKENGTLSRKTTT